MSELPYRRWVVWQRADVLACALASFIERPDVRVPSFLRDQLMRSAYSIPANIAEGLGRATPLDTASFLDRARGSLFETDYWLGVLSAREVTDPAVAGRWRDELGELNAMLVAVKKKLYERAASTPRRARAK